MRRYLSIASQSVYSCEFSTTVFNRGIIADTNMPTMRPSHRTADLQGFETVKGCWICINESMLSCIVPSPMRTTVSSFKKLASDREVPRSKCPCKPYFVRLPEKAVRSGFLWDVWRSTSSRRGATCPKSARSSAMSRRLRCPSMIIAVRRLGLLRSATV